MDDYEIDWSANARRSLAEIVSYLTEQNVMAADRWLARVEQTVELLKVTPGIGSRTGELTELEIREFVAGRYRVFYQVERSQSLVRILLVWHSARRHPDTRDLGLRDS